MKKIIAFIIIAAITLSCFMSINVGAADDFGKAEAEALLIEAYQRFILMQDGITYADVPFLKEDYVGAQGPDIPREHMVDIEYITSSRGEIYLPSYSFGEVFHPVTDPRFDTMEKCYAYASEVFTEDWARIIVDYNRNDGTGKLEAFRPATPEGMLDAFERPSPDDNITLGESEYWKDLKVVAPYGYNDSDLTYRLYSIGDFSRNGDTATLKVVMRRLEHYVAYHFYDQEVTFKKTADGWRVSGGSFFEGMMFRGWKTKNPLTSDETPVTVAILGTVAVISLAIPVAFYKKKQRVA